MSLVAPCNDRTTPRPRSETRPGKRARDTYCQRCRYQGDCLDTEVKDVEKTGIQVRKLLTVGRLEDCVTASVDTQSNQPMVASS